MFSDHSLVYLECRDVLALPQVQRQGRPDANPESVTLTATSRRGHIPAPTDAVFARTDLGSVGVVLVVDSAAGIVGIDGLQGGRRHLSRRLCPVHHTQHLHDGHGNCRKHAHRRVSQAGGPQRANRVIGSVRRQFGTFHVLFRKLAVGAWR